MQLIKKKKKKCFSSKNTANGKIYLSSVKHNLILPCILYIVFSSFSLSWFYFVNILYFTFKLSSSRLCSKFFVHSTKVTVNESKICHHKSKQKYIVTIVRMFLSLHIISIRFMYYSFRCKRKKKRRKKAKLTVEKRVKKEKSLDKSYFMNEKLCVCLNIVDCFQHIKKHHHHHPMCIYMCLNYFHCLLIFHSLSLFNVALW